MQLKVRLLDEASGVLIGAELGCRVEDPCVDQPGKDGVEVVAEAMPGADHGTDPVQAEFVIDLLEEEVAAVEAALWCRSRMLREVHLSVPCVYRWADSLSLHISGNPSPAVCR